MVSPATSSDDSIFPYSCCDLSTIDASSECPPDKVPNLGNDLKHTQEIAHVSLSTTKRIKCTVRPAKQVVLSFHWAHKYHFRSVILR